MSDIYDNLLVKTGYMKVLEDANTVEAEGRIENLMEFKSVIFDYEDDAENPTIFRDTRHSTARRAWRRSGGFAM